MSDHRPPIHTHTPLVKIERQPSAPQSPSHNQDTTIHPDVDKIPNQPSVLDAQSMMQQLKDFVASFDNAGPQQQHPILPQQQHSVPPQHTPQMQQQGHPPGVGRQTDSNGDHILTEADIQQMREQRPPPYRETYPFSLTFKQAVPPPPKCTKSTPLLEDYIAVIRYLCRRCWTAHGTGPCNLACYICAWRGHPNPQTAHLGARCDSSHHAEKLWHELGESKRKFIERRQQIPWVPKQIRYSARNFDSVPPTLPNGQPRPMLKPHGPRNRADATPNAQTAYPFPALGAATQQTAPSAYSQPAPSAYSTPATGTIQPPAHSAYSPPATGAIQHAASGIEAQPAKFQAPSTSARRTFSQAFGEDEYEGGYYLTAFDQSNQQLVWYFPESGRTYVGSFPSNAFKIQRR